MTPCEGRENHGDKGDRIGLVDRVGYELHKGNGDYIIHRRGSLALCILQE